jgi:hypothetical protein
MSGLLPQTVDLGAAGCLRVQPGAAGGEALLLVTAADGTPRLQLSLTAGELVLDCLGGSTRLRVGGALAVEAGSLQLTTTHDMALNCGGDLRLRAAGRIDAVADAVAIEALRGDAQITANDDVRLEGERVRTNC